MEGSREKGIKRADNPFDIIRERPQEKIDRERERGRVSGIVHKVTHPVLCPKAKGNL